MRKRGAVSERKRKRKKRTRCSVAPRVCGAEVRGVVKKPTPSPRVCEREGVPYAPSESQPRTKRKKKKRGGYVPEQRRVPERGEGEGMSQSEVRGRACPRAM